MSARKQLLLKAHRRRKRITLLVVLLAALALGAAVAWWLLPLVLLAAWVAHEAWFADHLFYRSSDDYQYLFPDDAHSQPVTLEDGRVKLSREPGEGETLILCVRVHHCWLGRWLDPFIEVGDDRQDFERRASGQRYLNLSGQREQLTRGELVIRGRRCWVHREARLYVMASPDYRQQRALILAPHADDAELAAFGFYSHSPEVAIATLTQGEIEADSYHELGLDTAAAARLKGRLRSWDSLAVPLWGGVKASHCVQLGYYCLQLPAMNDEPGKAFGSRESGESDIRSVRRHNPLQLPADRDGAPTWENLVADLVALLEHYRPEVIITPHPELDPHADHVATTQAIFQAIAQSDCKPGTALFYANHLHDNDRWPMGPAGTGVALPPTLEPLPADRLWSPSLDPETQLDKAMALGMQHDLRGPLPLKERVRRLIQWLLGARRWPVTGEDEFFRKAVRRHELFWVRRIAK
ncbi:MULTISPECIES: PIG-L deacetylase family protein [unclassified Pseudomonas]|uniref:PIG-L deacetylase family protein n=1 Tax=unclassified Pseudomonas TaxID=196821 RepID=UPI0035BF9C41